MLTTKQGCVWQYVPSTQTLMETIQPSNVSLLAQLCLIFTQTLLAELACFAALMPLMLIILQGDACKTVQPLW